MPFTFNALELCLVTINGKPCTRAKEVCRALEYGKATKTADIVKHLSSRENYAHKWQLQSSFPKRTSWIGPGTREKMAIASMRKGCTNWHLEVNSLRQKTSESIVAVRCFQGFNSSLQTKWRKIINRLWQSNTSPWVYKWGRKPENFEAQRRD